jgi:vacuolar-type H+-ATPase subunit I/STV1
MPLSNKTDQLGSIEGPVARYLQLVQRKREIEEEYRSLNKKIKAAKKDPQLMNAIGLINRLQEKRDKPEDSEDEGLEEEVEPKKRKTSDSRAQLLNRMNREAPKVDKTLQTNKEK